MAVERARGLYTEGLRYATWPSKEAADLLQNRAACNDALGETVAVAEDCRRCLSMQPTHAKALRRLARVSSAHTTSSNQSATDREQLPHATLAECCDEPGAGRGMRSSRAGKAGDVVLSELPLAYVLHKPHRNVRCSNCFTKLTSAPLPCRGCSGPLLFCSSACAEAAAAGAHAHECGAGAFAFVLPENAILATRLLARQASGATNGLLYDGSNALPVGERLETAVMACTIAACLQESRDARLREIATPERALIALCQVRFNSFAAHAHARVRLKRSSSTLEKVTLGIAVYTTASLFNHSCAPNCHASFHGPAVELRLTEDVEPHQFLHISYGPEIGLRADTSKRRRQLERSHAILSCDCRACTSQDVAALEQRDHAAPMRAKILRDAALDHLEGARFAEAAHILEECLQCLHASNMPHRRVPELCDALADCYEAMGALSRACEVARIGLLACARRHVRNCVPLANELLRYAERACRAGCPRDALAACDSADEMLGICLGAADHAEAEPWRWAADIRRNAVASMGDDADTTASSSLVLIPLDVRRS